MSDTLPINIDSLRQRRTIESERVEYKAGWNPESVLQQGRAVSARYRNRWIGELLKELDLAEGRSTGVPKILRTMRNNGSPPPSFDTADDRTWFRVRLPAHPSLPSGRAMPATNKIPNKSPNKLSVWF